MSEEVFCKYLKQAKIELDDAIRYYEAQQTGLGLLFQIDVKQAISIIVNFPHNILYAILENSDILIVAVGYQHRMPDF